ncbi:MAG TPA: FtsX-like permease family protein [Xanthobacteraceae bacterium]|jgi:cell division transport system permease protein|nr:FtsX-like permease family protein [Xanthobacteraceae bacterium]
MSMIDTGIGADARDQGDAAAGAADMPLPSFEAPIVPKATIAGRALIAVIAIMTFLASITIGAVMLLRAAAGDWQAELAREVTIQVRPVAGRDIEADIAKAAAIAGAARGVASVRPYSKQESSQLLQPWLGGLALDELPVPRLVAVAIAPGELPDLGRLRGALAEQVPPASLDDHREFVDHMRLMSRAMVAGATGVLALVMIATVLSVTFATRGMMATNRQVIEVLHFIGARNSFIAGHFQRHFLLLGLKGGALGGGLALLLFGLVDFANGWLLASATGAQLAALFGTFSIGLAGYAAVLAQIVLTALVTAATSRHTVNRTLETVR